MPMLNQHLQKKPTHMESRERIIQTAVMLFARKGYAETGLRELAATAKVNLAMINYFFGSKKELLKEILDTFFSGYLDIAREQLAGPDSLQHKIGRFIRRAVNYFDHNRDYLLVTITELPHDDPEIIDHKANWAKKMIGIIDQEICLPLAKETGRKILPTSMAPLLVSLMAARFIFAPVMEQVDPGTAENIDLPAYSDMITDIFLQGVTARNWKKTNN